MVNLAIAEHGDISTWDWEKSTSRENIDEFVKKYFLPYLNVAKICSSSQASAECFPNIEYKHVNGTNWRIISNMGRTALVLNDGTNLAFGFYTSCFEDKNRCLELYVDINGHKKPNTIGRDLFDFNFYPQTGEFLPFGTNVDKTFNEETQTFSKYDEEFINTNCTTQGWTCATKIVTEGFKMNY